MFVVASESARQVQTETGSVSNFDCRDCGASKARAQCTLCSEHQSGEKPHNAACMPPATRISMEAWPLPETRGKVTVDDRKWMCTPRIWTNRTGLIVSTSTGF